MTFAIMTDKIIIATGSRPSKPPIPGIDGGTVIDSDEVLGLTKCPDKVVIIGGGGHRSRIRDDIQYSW